MKPLIKPSPSRLNIRQEAILSYHQSPRLLEKHPWAKTEIKPTNITPDTTIFDSNEPGGYDGLNAPFTNFGDSISVCEERNLFGIKLAVCWKITAGDRADT